MTPDPDSVSPADLTAVDDLLEQAAVAPPVPDPAAIARITSTAMAAAADVLDRSEAASRRNREVASGVELAGQQRGHRFVDITGAQVAAWRDGQADPAVAAAIERAVRLGDAHVLALQARLDRADRLLSLADAPQPSRSQMRRLRVAATEAARDHLDATSTHRQDAPAQQASDASATTGPARGLGARVTDWLGSGTALRVAGGLATIAIVAVVGTQVLPQAAFDGDGAASTDLAAMDDLAAAPELEGGELTSQERAGSEERLPEFSATDAAAATATSSDAVMALAGQLQVAPRAGSVKEIPVVRLDPPLPPELLTSGSRAVERSMLRAPDAPIRIAEPSLDAGERATVRACLDAFVARPDRVMRIALVADEAGAPDVVVVAFPGRLRVLDVADCG